MEPSGKYFASLLYEGYSCENQAADEDYSNAKILGIDYAMQGMAVFSEEIELEKAGFFRRNEKRLAREQRKLSRKRKLPGAMKKYETRERIICIN